jgi:iron complex outermembrane receptor protein
MIQWQPQSGFWTPVNKNQVWIRGVDFRLKAIKKVKKISLEFTSLMQWVSSQNIDRSPENSSEYRKQLMYVPQWQLNYSLGLRYSRTHIEWQSQFTGIRNTSSDGLTSLPAFWLHNLRINQNFKNKKLLTQAFVCINNLFNQSYQVVAFRAMPMRNIQTGIQIQFNTK